MLVKDIAKVTGGKLRSGDPDLDVDPSKISMDSRSMGRGEFFIALSGPNFDGSEFVNDAFRKGASGAIVRGPVKMKTGKVIIEVKDTTKALQAIARAHRMKFKIPVIAVTGSNGKTTVKDMIWTVLSARYNVLRNEGTKNNHIGVPQTLLKLNAGHEFLVLELGTNHKGEIKRLAAITAPTIAVISNIGPSHMEFLKSTQGVYREKKDILKFLDKRQGAAIINGDDAFLSKVKNGFFKVVKFGMKASNDFRASNILTGNGKLKFRLNGRMDFELNLLGHHNIYNALAAIAVGRRFKIDYDTIRRSLAGYKPTYMRLDLKKIGGMSVIDDSYNSNPLSMRAAVEALRCFPAGAKWVVSADMLELGRSSDHFHRMAGHFIAQSGVKGLITFGELSKHTLSGARQCGMDEGRLWHCSSHDEIAGILKRVVREGDVVLVKGSRSMKMEEVLNKLKG